jgi:uncharacterized protein YraI
MRGLSSPSTVSFTGIFAWVSIRLCLIGLVLLACASDSRAETLVPAAGGEGGTPKRVDCEPGSYVVGFTGRAGSWLDQISLLCGRWDDKSGVLQSPANAKVSEPFGDSTGGEALTETCPDGWAVSGYDYRVTQKSLSPLETGTVTPKRFKTQFVHSIRFYCRPAIAGSGEAIRKTIGSWSEGYVTRFYGTWECPRRELATGMHGRTGLFVDKFGLVCNLRPEPVTVGVEIKTPSGPIVAEGPIAGTRLETGPIVAAPPGGTDIDTSSANQPQQIPPQAPAPPQTPPPTPGPIAEGPIAGTKLEPGPIVAIEPASSPFFCRGGGNMDITPTPGGVLINFRRAPEGAIAQPPGEGECAWNNRALSVYEPQSLFLADNTDKGEALRAATGKGGAFEVAAYNNTDAGRLQVAFVRAVTLPPQAPPPPQPPAPGPVADVCGPPGGTAVVKVTAPGLTKLNVRSGPGGKVLGTIPHGTEVSIIGPCGPAGSAGLTAPGQTPTGSRWCQIDRPVAGCVAAQFLALGETGGAAGFAKPAPPPAPEPSTTPAPTGGGQGVAAKVIKAANVRSSPANADNIIGKLPANAQVIVTGCQASWCRLDVPGGVEAWAHQSLLALAGPAGGSAEPQVPTAPPPPPQGPVVAAPQCDRPAGPAVVVIEEPGLDKLNVRETPGGKVIGAIPKGSQVSIIGPCGAENAAGIAAPTGQGGAAGWCQIGSPVTGCVLAKYLVSGSGGAAGIGKAPEAPPPAAPSFAGAWDTVAGGVAHAITFEQNGNAVTGAYSAADGSSGTISGEQKGKVLRFSWAQADGVRGVGKFTLSGDGNSFEGSYGYADNPEVAQGSWNGTRK